MLSRPFRVENSVGVIVSVWLRGREHGRVEMMGSDVPGEDSEANEKGLCASLGSWTSPCKHRASPRSSQRAP